MCHSTHILISSSYYVNFLPLNSFIFLFYLLSFPTVYILSLFLEKRVPKIVDIITLYSAFSFEFLSFRTVGLNILTSKKEGKGRDIPDLPPNFTLKKSFLLNKEVRTCIHIYSRVFERRNCLSTTLNVRSYLQHNHL